MSSLVVMLTAAMAVPGSGPEKVSGEMTDGLDLHGEWEGTLQGDNIFCRAVIREGKLITHDGTGKTGSNRLQVVNEGDGKIRISLDWTVCLGIYEQRGDDLLIAYRWHELGRPSFLGKDKKQGFLILRRVKPRK